MRPRSRLAAGAAALAVEALLVAALIVGLAGPARIGQAVHDGLTAITLAPPPPVHHHPHAAAAAAPAARHVAVAPQTATAVIARPVIVAPPPGGPVAHGDIGSGVGGMGAGIGNGGHGAGAGGSDPELLSGDIRDHDIPASARAAGYRGDTDTHLLIGPDGRVTDCRITGSSGNADLDAVTCRLVVKRFRFAPARSADGRAVAGAADYTQQWDVARDEAE